MAKELVLEQHIESTSGIRSGKPCLVGTRLTVADVTIMHLRLGYALEEISGEHDVSLAAVHTAMAYYYDHQDEIETEMAESKQFTLEMAQNSRSLLQEKLKNGCI